MKLTMLSKVKYFGVRYLYYNLKNKFPFIKPLLLDIFKPGIVSRRVSKRLIRKYHGYIGHGVVESDESYLGYGMLHYDMIRINKPLRVLCIGSYRGFIPVICAMACRDNAIGMVDFVDAGVDKGENSLLGDGYWKKNKTLEHFDKNVSGKYLTTYVMTTREFKKKFPDKTYDYIYVDGDHTKKGVEADYKLFWPGLNKNGFMLFHDVLGKRYGGVKFGVNKFWTGLKTSGKIVIPYPKETGLGILQKT